MSELETAAAAPEAAPVDATPTPADPLPEASSPPEVERDDIDESLRDVWRHHNQPPEGERLRDESGRFVAKDVSHETSEGVKTPPEALTEAAKVEAEQPEAEGKQPETPEVPSVEPPRAWNAEAKAKWATLPPDLQQFVAGREQELQEIRTASGRLAAEYTPLRQTLESYKPYLDQVAHGDVPGFMQRVLAASHALDTNPAQTIKMLAESYGVDIGDLYDPLAEPPNTELVKLRQETARLQAQLDAASRQSAASQEAAQHAEVQKTIDAFYAKHPDIAEIENDFAAEIHAVRQSEPSLDHSAVLEKAYERAVWANPAMRQKRIAEIARADEAKRIEAAKANANKARSAASVNVSGSPASSSGSDDDWNAQMAAIFRKNNAA